MFGVNQLPAEHPLDASETSLDSPRNALNPELFAFALKSMRKAHSCIPGLGFLLRNVPSEPVLPGMHARLLRGNPG